MSTTPEHLSGTVSRVEVNTSTMEFNPANPYDADDTSVQSMNFSHEEAEAREIYRKTGNVAPVARANISLAEAMTHLGDEVVQADFQGEPGALMFPSTRRPYHQPPRSRQDYEETPIRQAGQFDAAMANPHAKALLDPGARASAKEMLSELRNMPAPDATTWVGHRKLVIPGEVISTPNKLWNQHTNQDMALKVLDKILGGNCTGDKRDRRINPETGKEEISRGDLIRCICPTHRVKRSAQSWGFRDKPINWLGQQLIQECEIMLRRQPGCKPEDDVRVAIPRGNDFDPDKDGDINADEPRALATLFSYEVADRIMMIAEARNVTVTHVTRVLCNRVCDKSDDLKAPKEYTSQYDM